MTTTTWTASIAAVTPEFGGFSHPGLKKLGRFVAVFFGATAEQDSAFRGLDLNGNAVWAHSHKR